MASRPSVDLTRAAQGGGPATEWRPVDIAALEAEAEDPARALAQRGFAAVPFADRFDVESDDPGWRQRFAAAVARTIGELVRPSHVLVLPSPGRVRRGNGSGADLALQTCHADFTATSATQKFAALGQAHPGARSARRFAAYNAWWLASEAPQDVPLALCDPRTVSAADLMPGSAVIHDAAGAPARFGEIAFYRYNPRHRWFWYPALSPGRLLIFSGHDSAPQVASQVPHCAFVDPACPSGVPTRVSVECRCFAYW